MKCLDLKVIEFKPDFYLRESYQCGWAWPVISGKIRVKIYVKYEIERWTYHDRMHIKVRAEKTDPNYYYIGEDDVYIIEDQNPSENAVTREKTIEKTLEYYDIGAAFKGEDYRRSGWRKWHFAFFTDSGGPVKAIDLSAYWDAESCKFTDYKVEGVECPFSSKEEVYKHVCDFLKSNLSKEDINDEVEYLRELANICTGDIKDAIIEATIDLVNLYFGSVTLDSLIKKYCKISPLTPQPNIVSVKFKYGTREISETGETLYAPAGKSVEVTVEIENASPTGGKCAIEIYNATTNTVLGFKEAVIPQGGVPYVSTTPITTYILMPECPDKCEIWVRTYYYDGKAWVKWDEKGPYYFSNKEEVAGVKVRVTSHVAGTIVAQKVAWDAGIFYILDPFTAKTAECNAPPCEIEFDLPDSAIGQKWVVYSVGLGFIPQPTAIPLIYVAKLPGYVAEITVEPGVNEVTLTGNINQFLENVACSSLSPILGFRTTSECIDFLYSFVDPYYIADVLSIFFTGRDLQGNERELTIADGIAVVFAIIPLVPSPAAKALTGVAKQAVRIVNRAFALEKTKGIRIFTDDAPKWLECFWKATESALKRIADLLEAGKIDEAIAQRDSIIANPPIDRSEILRNARTWFDGILSIRKDDPEAIAKAWNNFRKTGALDALKKIAYEYAEKVASNISELRKIARELIWEDNPDEFIKTIDEGIWDDVIRGTESIVDGGITFRELFSVELFTREDWVDKIAKAKKLDTLILNIFEKFRNRSEQFKVLANSLSDSEIDDMVRILSKYDADFYAHELKALKTMKTYEGTIGANKLGEALAEAEEKVVETCQKYTKKLSKTEAEKVKETLTEGHAQAVCNTLDKIEPDDLDNAFREAFELGKKALDIETPLRKTAIVKAYLRKYKVDRLTKLSRKVLSRILGFIAKHPTLTIGTLIGVTLSVINWCCGALFMTEEGWQTSTFGVFPATGVAQHWYYLDPVERSMVLNKIQQNLERLQEIYDEAIEIYHKAAGCCPAEWYFNTYKFYFESGAKFYLDNLKWYKNYLELHTTPQPVRYNVAYVKITSPYPAYVLLAGGEPLAIFRGEEIDGKLVFKSTRSSKLEHEGYLVLPIRDYSTTYHICLKVVENGAVVKFAIKSITLTKSMVGKITTLEFREEDFRDITKEFAPKSFLEDITKEPNYDIYLPEDLSVPQGERLFEEFLGSSWDVSIDIYPSPVVGEEITVEAKINNIDIDPSELYFEWTLPDGTRKTGWGLTKFTYIFNKSGYFTIQLRVTPPVGETKERSQRVYVAGAGELCPEPRAAFTWTPRYHPEVGDEITFDASASEGGRDHEIVEYYWDFGDGTTERTDKPRITHVYNEAKEYIVKLTVKNDCGKTDTATYTIKVYEKIVECPKPRAIFTWAPRYPTVGEEVIFDASASEGGDGHTIVEYEWDFGDGTVETTSEPRITHEFKEAKDYIVRLTVKNDCGKTDTATYTVSVKEIVCPRPYAIFTISNVYPEVGKEVVFDASASNGGDGHTIVEYEWDFGDGATKTTTKPVVRHIYTEEGDYIVKLTVKNDCGAKAIATAAIHPRKKVEKPPECPRPYATFTPSKREALVGEEIIFDASASEPGKGAKIVEYRWDFRDGTPEVVTTEPVVTHTFNRKGDYIVKLTVKNDCGETDTYTKAISIVEEMPECPKPLAYFVPSTYIAEIGQVLKFDASGSKPGEGRKIVRYEWEFGDGTSKTTTKPEIEHAYSVAGTYYVRLTVYNDCGEYDTVSGRIVVAKCPRPYATFTVSNTYPEVGKEVVFDASASEGGEDHKIVEYEWDFGDGTKRTTYSPVVRHTYTKEGDYIVKLIVINDCGEKDICTVAVHPREKMTAPVVCPKPYATFTVSTGQPLVGEEITFDASASDPGQGAKIVEYRWEFGDGMTKTTTEPVVKHTYNKVGDYIVRLTVKNDCGEIDVYTKSIHVVEETPECPKPLAYFVPSTYVASVGQVIKFDASGSKPGEGRKIVRYEWDWGDGTSIETTEPVAQHSYMVGGRSYYVRLTVYNDCGEWDYTTARIDVRKPKGARVEIVTRPSGAKVYIDGKLIFERIKRVLDLMKKLRR